MITLKVKSLLSQAVDKEKPYGDFNALPEKMIQTYSEGFNNVKDSKTLDSYQSIGSNITPSARNAHIKSQSINKDFGTKPSPLTIKTNKASTGLVIQRESIQPLQTPVQIRLRNS